jgi:hypothetical protein
MIVKGKLDENEKESQKWMRETLTSFSSHDLQSCSSSVFPTTELVHAESLIAVLADIRFIQHETIRTLAVLATKIQDLSGRLEREEK